MKKKPKHIIIERPLGRESAAGQALLDEIILDDMDDQIMEIDPRQSQREYLETLIHEKLHLLHPDWSEKKINKTAKPITTMLWNMNYRRIMK